jgi:CDP-diacylglycerol--glycerol-3-phosphate 3-phosphatidyltransferase
VTGAERGAERRRPETIELAGLRAQPGDEPHWVNLPNALTFLRALLVPVILWLLTLDDRAAQWWAFGIFVFAAATDSIDGWVARRWHGVTRWGQLADPIADKLLIIGALTSLALVEMLPWWAVLVIAGREIAVTLLRVRLVRRLDLVMPASRWGKSKTLAQVTAVGAFLWPGVPEGVRLVLLYGAVALTLWSGVEYAFRAGRLARDRRADDTVAS